MFYGTRVPKPGSFCRTRVGTPVLPEHIPYYYKPILALLYQMFFFLPSKGRANRASDLSHVLAAEAVDCPQAVSVLRAEQLGRHGALVRQEPNRRCSEVSPTVEREQRGPVEK